MLESPVDADIVIGAPDSGIASNVGYAEESVYRDGNSYGVCRLDLREPTQS